MRKLEQAQKIFSVAIEGDVAVVTVDVPGEAVNTVSHEMLDEFHKVLRELDGNSSVKAAVLLSGKPDAFIAGAKLEMLQGVKSAADGEALSKSGQQGSQAAQAPVSKPHVVFLVAKFFVVEA